MALQRAFGRFEIEEQAGSGSTGTIYRGIDTINGERVAVKVLRGLEDVHAARFVREARILARVRHPGVVRYIDHGRADGGHAYLVMEWLEGEDLRERLARAGLTMNESILLARRVAEALAVVHAQGLVHRDIKPANLFLPGGRVEDAKIIDFGLARGAITSAALTQTGLVLGTPSYMAPEQARGKREIDARADLFSLGAVMFKCLTGHAPFEGRSIMAVLTKVLLDDAPRVSDMRADVPEALDALVARLLAKEPEDRPPDATAVAAALVGLGPLGAVGDLAEPSPPSGMLSGLTQGEQRVTAMLLIGHSVGESAAPPSSGTRGPEGDDVVEARLSAIADEHGAKLDRLVDGTRVVTLVGGGVPTDQTSRAARCALALHTALPSAPMALATGRSEVARLLPVGEAIERAAQMLSRRREALWALPPEPPPRAVIAVDEVTAALLGPRFDVAPDNDGLTLRGLRPLDTGARTLLGQATPMVGRDWEIGSIESLFRECMEEGARAVLITAPAGMGKSRLAHEVVRALRRRVPELEVWAGSGDPLRAGSALALLGQIVRSACRVVEGEPVEVRRQRLVEGVEKRVPAADAARVADILGEVAEAPASGEIGVALRAARQDARIMSVEVASAWEALVAGATKTAPLLIVIEDMHWGDTATARLIDGVLASLPRRPFMVLALARPEVHDVFPRLWEGKPLQEIRLKRLGRRASEQLVRAVLAGAASEALAARLAAQADGNAFYLEELIRAVAEGSGAGDVPLPATVLAMVQARLAGLDADTRRVLRAASVFGEVFWSGGVSALLGGSVPRAGSVDVLVAQELVVVRSTSRFPNEREIAFRHALLREGAYAMLTEADRVLGHRLAAEWLSQHGEGDAMVLAQHFELAREGARAGQLYLQAAWNALRGGDPALAIERAERARAAGLPESERIPHLRVLSQAYAWNDLWTQAADVCEELIARAAPGSAPWMDALAIKQIAASTLGRPAALIETLGAIMSTEPEEGAVTPLAQALALSVLVLCFGAQFEMAAGVLARMETVVVPRSADEPVARGWTSLARTFMAAWGEGDPWAALGHARAAHAGFDEAHDATHARLAQAFVAMSQWNLGAYEEAERGLRALPLQGADHMPAVVVTIYLAAVLTDLGAIDEVRSMLRERIAIAEARTPHHEHRISELRWLLGNALFHGGDLEGAERELTQSLAALVVTPSRWQLAATNLASVLLARGRAAEALALSRSAMSAFVAQRGFGLRGSMIELVHVEALEAAGEHDEARAALRDAHATVLRRAARIPDLAVRAVFLERVPENARLLTLAQARFGESAS
ncbi:Adenylate cyclase [Minicystis rosea]|nr:Adenylate cyclase [Minicystis rosea]